VRGSGPVGDIALQEPRTDAKTTAARKFYPAGRPSRKWPASWLCEGGATWTALLRPILDETLEATCDWARFRAPFSGGSFLNPLYETSAAAEIGRNSEPPLCAWPDWFPLSGGLADDGSTDPISYRHERHFERGAAGTRTPRVCSPLLEAVAASLDPTLKSPARHRCRAADPRPSTAIFHFGGPKKILEQRLCWAKGRGGSLRRAGVAPRR